MGVATKEVRRAFGLGEFASMFGVSLDTAKRLVTAGGLRTITIGRRRLVPISEIERIERDGLQKKAR
jgi:excisionase family DNA binding protein